MHTAPPFQVAGLRFQVASQNLLAGIRPPGYFELTDSFAHRKMARGRLNQKIHIAFSNLRQISAPSPSGNKLIVTISFPPLD